VTDRPSFVLGTGDAKFIGELTDGQVLKMERGPQGGCHLPLAFRTDGFLGKGMRVDYALQDLDTPRLITEAGALVDMIPVADMPERCETLAFRAFMTHALDSSGHRVQITVTLTDIANRTGMKRVTVIAQFPDIPADAGLDPAHWCM
jgi:hypothetical protein